MLAIYKSGVWGVSFTLDTKERWRVNKQAVVVCETAGEAIQAVLTANPGARIESVNRRCGANENVYFSGGPTEVLVSD